MFYLSVEHRGDTLHWGKISWGEGGHSWGTSYTPTLDLSVGLLLSPSYISAFVVCNTISTGLSDYPSMQCNVQLNRKVLSELAIHEPKTFQVCN